jgi:hypothetical protein
MAGDWNKKSISLGMETLDQATLSRANRLLLLHQGQVWVLDTLEGSQRHTQGLFLGDLAQRDKLFGVGLRIAWCGLKSTWGQAIDVFRARWHHKC